MANAERGEVDLRVDGKDYVLRVTANAEAEVETLFGGKPFGSVVMDWAGGSVTVFRALLFGALREHHKELSLFDAGDIISADRDLVATKLGDAINLAYPPKKKAAEDGGENPPIASPKAGTSS